MKKFLLLAAAGLVAGTSFAAVGDAVYAEVDGMCLKNRVLVSETSLGKDAYGKMPWMNSPNFARTACLAKYKGKDVILIANSKDDVDGAIKDFTAIYIVEDFYNDINGFVGTGNGLDMNIQALDSVQPI